MGPRLPRSGMQAQGVGRDRRGCAGRTSGSAGPHSFSFRPQTTSSARCSCLAATPTPSGTPTATSMSTATAVDGDLDPDRHANKKGNGNSDAGAAPGAGAAQADFNRVARWRGPDAADAPAPTKSSSRSFQSARMSVQAHCGASALQERPDLNTLRRIELEEAAPASLQFRGRTSTAVFVDTYTAQSSAARYWGKSRLLPIVAGPLPSTPTEVTEARSRSPEA